MDSKLYAVIDIGSNTNRLVIFKKDGYGRLNEIENVKSVTRLRNFLDKEGNLIQDGIVTLLKTLRSFKEVVKNYPIDTLICAATATLRVAKNKETIKKIVNEQIGWDLEILTEEEEAFYGYLSVVNSTIIHEALTVDLGGASTEVTYFKDRKLIYSHSFPFGSLSLKYIFNEMKDINELEQYINEQLSAIPWLRNIQVPLIGIGGSARNLAQIDQFQKNYPMGGLHQYKINSPDLERLVSYLSSLSFQQLQKLEGLSKDRADTIVPAAIVFSSIYKFINAPSFIVSKNGLREGIFYKELYIDKEYYLAPSVLKNSIQELVIDYGQNETQINHVKKITHSLYKQLNQFKLADLTEDDWQLLQLAIPVYYLGKYIDSESSSQHTFYLLANRTINGLMHKERLKLALVASYKNKTLFKQFIKPFTDWLSKAEQEKLQLLGAMVKFTYSLDATKRQAIKDIKVEIVEKNIIITCFSKKEAMAEQYEAEKNKKQLEKTLKQDIQLLFY